ncbi:MAG: 50S ribosomal protein L7 [Oscillospiraceae bacterium]|nr:50S ribosomal protein L7 [Oscillospiraceae bacterium]
MGKSNVLSTLGLCKRAGKLIVGFDAAVADLEKSAGVLTASDLSEKSAKEIAFHCDKHGKKVVQIGHTMSDIQSVLNKKTGIISVLDEGLFAVIIESLTK